MSKKIVNIVPPKAQVMMTGVAYITQDRKLTTLHYTDGTHETGTCKSDIQDSENFFDIVSIIQSQRSSSYLQLWPTTT